MNQNIENLCHNLLLVKQELSELLEEEENLKQQIHDIMNQNYVNTIETDNYKCRRAVRTRDTISRDNVPENIWETYSTPTVYHVLNVKRIER